MAGSKSAIMPINEPGKPANGVITKGMAGENTPERGHKGDTVMARFSRQVNTKRRISTKVVGGKVQRKDRFDETPSYWNTSQPIPVIDRQRPGPGYRHMLLKRDVEDFIEILPDWDELSVGLDAIVLAEGEEGMYGWYDMGVIGICAWPRKIWVRESRDHYGDHKDLFERLGVEPDFRGEWVLWKHTEATVKAFQLMRVLVHELGHHYDRMNSRNQEFCGRGEDFAENYAIRNQPLIMERYFERFGLV